MVLPKLNNFSTNINQLHQATILFGPINNSIREKQQNWLHLPMQVYPNGLKSGKYPNGSEFEFDFKAGQIVYHVPEQDSTVFKLADHTQKSLFEALLGALQATELVGYFDGLEGDSLAEKMMRKIHAAKSETLDAALAEHTHEENLAHDSQVASEYADVQYTVYTGVARWRGRINGHLSPIVVWAEHFDLSTLWFVEGDMDEYKAHINIGFAPYTEGSYKRPYLYAYAYPYPDNFTPPELAAPLKWESEAYTGVYVAYDDIAQDENPEQLIEALCQQIFEALSGLLE